MLASFAKKLQSYLARPSKLSSSRHQRTGNQRSESLLQRQVQTQEEKAARRKYSSEKFKRSLRSPEKSWKRESVPQGRGAEADAEPILQVTTHEGFQELR